MKSITVAKLFEETKEILKLELLNNESSFSREINEPDLHRPGLALSGFVDVFTFQRIQIIGNTEAQYMRQMPEKERIQSIKKLASFAIPCIIITEYNEMFPEFMREVTDNGISIFRTEYSTTKLMHLLSGYMDHKFAPSITVHGSLVDVYGIGVMFTGRSGIGKSEIALDLVERGHRLVTDDIVHISRKAEGILIGTASEMLQHHMEIRGVGIVDVRSMFGIRAIRLQKRVEVEVQLEEWDDEEDYERIGLDESITEILGVEIPVVRLPIFPGKNITVIAEVVALQQLLKINGYNPAQEFNDRLIRRIQKKTDTAQFFQRYLDRDIE